MTININIKKILFTITGICWLGMLSTFLFPLHTFTQESFIVPIFVTTAFTALSVIALFQIKDKNVWSKQHIFSKILYILGVILATAVTAFISFFVTLFISVIRDPRSLSTYGTPTFRPKAR